MTDAVLRLDARCHRRVHDVNYNRAIILLRADVPSDLVFLNRMEFEWVRSSENSDMKVVEALGGGSR